MTGEGCIRDSRTFLRLAKPLSVLLLCLAFSGCAQRRGAGPYDPLPTDPALSRLPDEAVYPARPEREYTGPAWWYTVRKGDTLWSIAQRFALDDWSQLLDANPGLDARALHVGQRIRVPGERRVPETPAAEPAPPDRQARQPLAPAPTVRAGMAEKRYAWPAQGRLACRFGQEMPWEPKLTCRGIVIEVEAGASVLASKSGIAFVMHTMPGLGKTVSLDHGDGTATTYGYNREILVRHGQFVKQGDALAKAGDATGGGESRVYFRIDGPDGPVDPLPLLPR